MSIIEFDSTETRQELLLTDALPFRANFSVQDIYQISLQEATEVSSERQHRLD